jgi:hypothetical protein
LALNIEDGALTALARCVVRERAGFSTDERNVLRKTAITFVNESDGELTFGVRIACLKQTRIPGMCDEPAHDLRALLDRTESP